MIIQYDMQDHIRKSQREMSDLVLRDYIRLGHLLVYFATIASKIGNRSKRIITLQPSLNLPLPYPFLHDRQPLHEILQFHLLLADDDAKRKTNGQEEEDSNKKHEVRSNIETKEIRKLEDRLWEYGTQQSC